MNTTEQAATFTEAEMLAAGGKLWVGKRYPTRPGKPAARRVYFESALELLDIHTERDALNRITAATDSTGWPVRVPVADALSGAKIYWQAPADGPDGTLHVDASLSPLPADHPDLAPYLSDALALIEDRGAYWRLAPCGCPTGVVEDCGHQEGCDLAELAGSDQADTGPWVAAIGLAADVVAGDHCDLMILNRVVSGYRDNADGNEVPVYGLGDQAAREPAELAVRTDADDKGPRAIALADEQLTAWGYRRTGDWEDGGNALYAAVEAL